MKEGWTTRKLIPCRALSVAASSPWLAILAMFSSVISCPMLCIVSGLFLPYFCLFPLSFFPPLFIFYFFVPISPSFSLLSLPKPSQSLRLAPAYLHLAFFLILPSSLIFFPPGGSSQSVYCFCRASQKHFLPTYCGESSN